MVGLFLIPAGGLRHPNKRRIIVLATNLKKLLASLVRKEPGLETYEVNQGAALVSNGSVVTRIGGVCLQDNGTYNLATGRPESGYIVAPDFLSMTDMKEHLSIHSGNLRAISAMLETMRKTLDSTKNECVRYPVQIDFEMTRMNVSLFQYIGAIEQEKQPICTFWLPQSQPDYPADTPEFAHPFPLTLKTNMRDIQDLIRCFAELVVGPVDIMFDSELGEIQLPIYLGFKDDLHPITQGMLPRKASAETEPERIHTPEGDTIPMFPSVLNPARDPDIKMLPAAKILSLPEGKKRLGPGKKSNKKKEDSSSGDVA
jgi:hypothetical protein